MTKLGCPTCMPSEACDRYHVYVIELDPEVMDEGRKTKFSEAHPDYTR